MSTNKHDTDFIIGKLRQLDLDFRKGRVKTEDEKQEHVNFFKEVILQAKAIMTNNDTALFRGIRDSQGCLHVNDIETIEKQNNQQLPLERK